LECGRQLHGKANPAGVAGGIRGVPDIVDGRGAIAAGEQAAVADVVEAFG